MRAIFIFPRFEVDEPFEGRRKKNRLCSNFNQISIPNRSWLRAISRRETKIFKTQPINRASQKPYSTGAPLKWEQTTYSESITFTFLGLFGVKYRFFVLHWHCLSCRWGHKKWSILSGLVYTMLLLLLLSLSLCMMMVQTQDIQRGRRSEEKKTQLHQLFDSLKGGTDRWLPVSSRK